MGLYTKRDGDEQLLLDALVDGVGRSGGKLQVKDAGGNTLRSENRSFASQADALSHVAGALAEFQGEAPATVGHRVVHGGPNLLQHQLITPAVLEELERCIHFAPLHIPMALELIRSAEKTYPQLPQFACFDTAFHTTLPEVASRFPLPRQLFDEGIRRYGFHGLSYESIVHQLGSNLPSRTVIAHLGSGASLAAVRDGRSVDTSMGLTPTGGIPMATRTGDLDPGILLYLMRVRHMDADSLEKLLNHDAGLIALSEGKADMRDLEKAAEAGDHDARLAIDMFCTATRKVIAAYATVLGGLDTLIFAGGIGEHSTTVRSEVCTGLSFLGVGIDKLRNEKNEAVISGPDSKILVQIVPAAEDRQIARHCRTLMTPNPSPA